MRRTRIRGDLLHQLPPHVGGGPLSHSIAGRRVVEADGCEEHIAFVREQIRPDWDVMRVSVGGSYRWRCSVRSGGEAVAKRGADGAKEGSQD